MCLQAADTNVFDFEVAAPHKPSNPLVSCEAPCSNPATPACLPTAASYAYRLQTRMC
jgi:hypothetical protein